MNPTNEERKQAWKERWKDNKQGLFTACDPSEEYKDKSNVKEI